MSPDDRYFLTYERQELLLREGAEERLSRLTAGGPRPSRRERVARMLIALAMHIAPSLRHAAGGPPTVHGLHRVGG